MDAGRPECSADEACDDGTFCNGGERCLSGRCVPGVAPCPSEECDEGRAICLCPEPDVDGDGVPAVPCGGGDCNDDDSEVHPGAEERCNGEDDDCDGAVDEGASAACSFPEASASCIEGRCGVEACERSFLDCDGEASNGCEVDGSSDAAHCGACDRACVLGSCVDGTCDDPVALALGALYSCALRRNGGVICWGGNRFGQLGDGVPDHGQTCVHRDDCALTYVRVADLFDVQHLDAKGNRSCAVSADGTVRCWGGNGGQLGDGTLISRDRPVEVVGIDDATRVSLGDSFSSLRRRGGEVWSFGGNFWGELGAGLAVDNVVEPVPVLGVDDALIVGAGSAHACALRASGELLCWGRNEHGQLGDGTTTDRFAPVAGPALVDVVGIAGGLDHTCARLGDGTVRCWGANDRGQLGDGTLVQSSVPVAVMGLDDATKIAAQLHQTCALRATGSIVCWGDNAFGQLGDGTMEQSATPVEVVGIDDAIDVSVGFLHVCALTSEDRILCWGDNRTGQLGDGTATQRSVPGEIALP